MTLRALVLSSCLSIGVAAAQTPVTASRAQSRRSEAQGLVLQITEGQGVNAAANRLKYLGEESYAAAELASALHHAADDRQREWLVDGLALLESRAAEAALLAALKDSNGAVRMRALQGLARLKSQAVAQLRPLLSDPSYGIRREAARALGASGRKEAGPILIRAAQAEGELEARAAMLIAVGQAKDARQVRALTQFLRHSSETTRTAAAKALCLLGAPAGFAFFDERMKSGDRHARRQALDLLEDVRHRSLRARLSPLLSDEDRALAAHAARLLYQAGDRTMLEWLVLASNGAEGDEKLVYEKELERLQLSTEARQAILGKVARP